MHVVPRTPEFDTPASTSPYYLGDEVTGNLANYVEGLNPVGEVRSATDTLPLNFADGQYSFTPTEAGIYDLVMHYEAGGVAGEEATTSIDILPPLPEVNLAPRDTVYE